jgi:hypothetical protein
VDNAQIEVFRRNITMGIDWYTDFYGLFRKKVLDTPTDIDYFHAGCPGQMTRLGWAYILYPDKLDNLSVFTAQPAETVMKTLVKYNVTVSNALTSNGRLTGWPLGGITIETDLGRGNVIDWKCPLKNLLSELQGIAKIAGGDFDLVKTGAATWDFRFYPGQLGTDRHASVAFSTANGNMKNPAYGLDKISESTIALVGGRGDASNRSFQTVLGNTYNLTTNYIEIFVHAADGDSDDYLIAKGKEALYSAQARNRLSFQVLQTPATQYGRDYFLGDLVSAYYKGITFQQKVHAINVSYDREGVEAIDVEMRDA